MKKIILMALLAFICSTTAAGKKVLYVTHEPGKYHKYTPQKNIFIEVAKKAGWDLTVSTGDHEPQIVALRDPKLTEGYDAIVYNFCFASSKDLDAVSNVITQTRDKGTPCMVIHCSMHSFWATFKPGKEATVDKGQAKVNAALVAEWEKANPGKDFPIWGDFTGVASTGHGPKAPIQIEKCCEHSATKSIPATGYTTAPVAELYNNFYVTDTVTPLLKGTQTQIDKKISKKIAAGKELNAAEKKKLANPKKSTATVMWVVPQGKSKVLGLSLGHDEGEWSQAEFQSLLTDGVNFLINGK